MGVNDKLLKFYCTMSSEKKFLFKLLYVYVLHFKKMHQRELQIIGKSVSKSYPFSELVLPVPMFP